MALERLDSRSIEDLARACAEQTSRPRAPAREPDPCYELFLRAFAPSPDGDAWQAILNQYWREIFLWLGRYASRDTVQEVLLRFWKAHQSSGLSFATRFPNVGAVMSYLKKCAIAVRIEAWREEKRHCKVQERLRDVTLVDLVLARTRPGQRHVDFDLKQSILSKLKDDQERVVFEGTFYYALPPREIQAERPDLFPDAQVVHRVKENLLKRLRRDQELGEWWSAC